MRSCQYSHDRPVALDAGGVRQQLGERGGGDLGAEAGDVGAGRSSSFSRPCSRSFMIAVAVKLLEWEATRWRWRGVSASPAIRSAWPNAASMTTSPFQATAIAQPGCSVARI